MSDGGADPAGGGCASECRCGGLERRVDAHLSREVGHHAVESGADNGVAPS